MSAFAIFLLLLTSYQEPAKPLRKVPLTAEQNRLVVEVNRQLKTLEEQYGQVIIRKQAILDTIVVTNKLGPAKLSEIKPGEFELEETPEKKAEDKKPEGGVRP